MTDQPEPDDTCQPIEIGGEIIRVRGAAEMSDESREALADLIAAAKRKMEAEAPQQIGALQNRLRLAHQARRAKEHQLDDIRRALCDIGFIDDDDPYSHADLADVIRQNGTVVADGQAACIHPDGYEGECPCPPNCDCCRVEAAARTTPDNHATSSDGVDNPLRAVVARAIELADEHSCQMQDGPDYRALADAALAAVQPELDRRGNLATGLSSMLELMQQDRDDWGDRHRIVSDQLDRIRALADEHLVAIPTNLVEEALDQSAGASAATEPDTRYAQAIADVQSSGPAAGGYDGPTVAEAAADDRTWDLRKAGE